jgi:antitoxin MazE
MEAVVQKWGNGLGVRIPSGAARKMSLRTGYKVYIVPFEQKPAYDLEALVAGITEGNMHGEISFGKPVGKEVW